MNKSYTKADRTRKFIIESTAVIFNKKGFAGTSLSDLTKATGLTKGSIYGNFENKEEVAVAVFDYNCSRVANLTSQEVNQATTCYDKLMAYVRVYQTIIKETMNRGGCPVLNTATEADDTNGLLRKRAANVVLNWECDLTAIIKKGVLEGEFKTNIDPRKTALSIIALIEGGIMISKVTGDLSCMGLILNTVETLIDQIER